MESELFGHKAGAFTGATRDKKGLFEEADGGTLFLDEVGELELTLQTKLLRAVQEGEFYRLGDNRPLKTDVRIVSASNKDIEKLSGDGRFREDLYYRLCQIRIDLPALRERREDIPILIDAFVREEAGKPLKISSRLLKAMLEYDWPGNIRELENVVKVAVALAEDGVIDARSIPSNYAVSKYLAAMKPGKSEAPSAVLSVAPSAPAVPAAKDGPAIDSKNRYDPSKSWYDYEKLIIAKAYRLTGFNAKEAGAMLGLAPATVYKKIREIGLADKNHPLYADEFHYEQGRPLQDYLKPVFRAALEHAGNKPYTAIANLKISQGYFYKVMKD
jgi:DNA-binding NtrC family response regulator